MTLEKQKRTTKKPKIVNSLKNYICINYYKFTVTSIEYNLSDIIVSHQKKNHYSKISAIKVSEAQKD